MAEKKRGAKKAGAGEIDVFEAYEAKHRKKAAAAKKGVSSAKRKKKKKKAGAWWALPVTIVMILILSGLGVAALHEKKQYEEFVVMREAVDVSGFYPGIAVEGQDVTGRMLNDVLADLAAQDQAVRDSLTLTISGGGRSWTVTANDLGYVSDYEDVARAAWQIGHEGSISQRYQAIRQLQQGGRNYTVSRGYEAARLRAVTDSVAAELTTPAQNAQVIAFDTETREFSYAREQNGTYVDAERLYQDALAAIQAGGSRTVSVALEAVYPTETLEDIRPQMGLMASARTFVAGDRDRRNNVSLALAIINGVRVEPGAIFSFNGTIGERTADAGFKLAGAFLDGLRTQELGGGICQVSTTLFNAVAKSDLELIARSPHSRPVDYVDKGKDAAVYWPNQDFKFQNDTPYPVYIATEFDQETRWCTVLLYGQMLPNGTYITIEAEVIKEFEPGEDVYIYTTELPTGQKEKVDSARTGYYCESYKIYHREDGTEISRELYCRTTYAAAGATYRVGQ